MYTEVIRYLAHVYKYFTKITKVFKQAITMLIRLNIQWKYL